MHSFLTKKILALLLALLLLPVGCKRTTREKLSKTGFLMDTVITVTLYEYTEEEALQEAFDEMSRLNGLLDVYTEGSDLYRLTEAAGKEPVLVSAETMELLLAAKEAYDLSDGYFDVTVGPLILLWDVANGGHYPTDGELREAMSLTGLTDLILDTEASTAYLRREGMRVDLGALAKGYIADKVKALLIDRGVTSAILDLGHNILLIGEKPGGEAFSVGVQSPNGEGYAAVVNKRDCSIVTSGTYERYFTYGGKTYHHILDPFTGFPADTDTCSVTVISKESLWGDVLSTTCLLLGSQKGLALIESLPDTEALFILTDGSQLSTSAFFDQ